MTSPSEPYCNTTHRAQTYATRTLWQRRHDFGTLDPSEPNYQTLNEHTLVLNSKLLRASRNSLLKISAHLIFRAENQRPQLTHRVVPPCRVILVLDFLLLKKVRLQVDDGRGPPRDLRSEA